MFDYVYDALNGSTAVVTFSDINAHDHVSISSDDFSIHGKDLQVYSHIADSPRHSEVVFVRGDGSTVASFMGTHAHELTINFDQRTASIAFDIPPLLELLGCDGQLLPPEEGSKYAGSVVIDGGQLQLAKNTTQSADGAPMQQRGEAVDDVDDATDENFDGDEGVVEIATSQREVVDAPIIEVSAPTETENSNETADTQQALEADQPHVTTAQDQLQESMNNPAAVQPVMDSEATIPASNNNSDEEEQAQEVAHFPVVEDLADLGEEIRTEGERVSETSAQPESALEVVVEDVDTEEDADILPAAVNVFSWI